MQTCIGCGCGFGLPPYSYKLPLHRGKDIICPSCDKEEKKKGYLHPSNYTFRVWNKDSFKDVHLLSYQGIEKAVADMKAMTPEQRRDYLVKKIGEIKT